MTPSSDFMSLSEMSGLSGGSERITAVLHHQRGRFLAMMGSLSAHHWMAGTRCTEWSVDDLARHVVDVAQRLDDRLNRRTSERFRRHGPFDPRVTPKLWLLDSVGREPMRTLEMLATLREQERASQDAMRERHDDVKLTGVLGRRAHWSVFVLHVLFDAWIHERDIAIPLRLTIDHDTEERTLLAMYALLLAAQPAAGRGTPIETSVVLLDGSDELAFTLRHEADRIIVEAQAPHAAPTLRGDLDTVLDSLVGRGPRLAEVLHGDPAIVAELSRLRDIHT